MWNVTENGCVITCSDCGRRLELAYPDGTEVRSLPYCPYCGAEHLSTFKVTLVKERSYVIEAIDAEVAQDIALSQADADKFLWEGPADKIEVNVQPIVETVKLDSLISS